MPFLFKISAYKRQIIPHICLSYFSSNWNQRKTNYEYMFWLFMLFSLLCLCPPTHRDNEWIGHFINNTFNNYAQYARVNHDKQQQVPNLIEVFIKIINQTTDKFHFDVTESVEIARKSRQI